MMFQSTNQNGMIPELKKLKIKLEKIERELDNCRTSAFIDGWQTSKHAKKSRKWDVLAQEKMKLKQLIEDIEMQHPTNCKR